MGTFRDAEGNEREFEIGEDGDVYEAANEEMSSDYEMLIPEMLQQLPPLPPIPSIPTPEELMRPANEALARAQQHTNEVLARSQKMLDEANARIEQQKREMEERMRRLGL